ncbi:MAG: TonB family protein [Sulfuritalea sp.]|nr:TonB family protein [Sulfuritalea sp.]
MTFHSLESGGLARQRLGYSIVASLLLHLLILWPDGTRLLTKDTPSLLQASLRLLPRPAPAPAPPPPRAVAPAPTIAPVASRPEPNPLERPAPASVPQAPAVPSVADVKAAPGPAMPVVPAVAKLATAAAGSVAGSLLTEANASGEAMDGLRGYRLAVAGQARRYKRYPAQAMASGWTGSAEIRVEVGQDGRPRAATVARTSGHETLDSAALAMIDAGALRARLPDSLRGKTFSIVLPVVFNLDDE